jgi:LEA14-like dessication related protein
MNKSLLSPFLGVLIGMFFISCGKVQEPQFRRIENFGVKNVSLQDATVGLEITYFNPNGFGVAVKEAVIDLYIDTVFIGQFLQPNQIDVTGEAEFSIPIEGKVSWRKIAQSNLHKQAGKEVLVKADGSVKVGKGGVFVKKAIKYSGKHVLDLDLLKNPAGAGF